MERHVRGYIHSVLQIYKLFAIMTNAMVIKKMHFMRGLLNQLTLLGGFVQVTRKRKLFT